MFFSTDPLSLSQVGLGTFSGPSRDIQVGPSPDSAVPLKHVHSCPQDPSLLSGLCV